MTEGGLNAYGTTHAKPWMLATDLDGTFLGGSEAERSRFYRYLTALDDNFMLIFVTGRELENTLPLFDDPLIPRPRYIISDVGTQAVDGLSFEPIAAFQDWVASRWNNANARIKRLLANEAGIVLQAVEPKYRVAYYYEPDKLQPGTLAKIRAAGFDYLLSNEQYLDVLPSGVAKGSALLKLLKHLGLLHYRVFVAGDTLNDLSLFHTGLEGIAMGNSEPKLITAITDLAHVYLSQHPGVMGIWDGLAAHGMLEQPA